MLITAHWVASLPLERGPAAWLASPHVYSPWEQGAQERKADEQGEQKWKALHWERQRSEESANSVWRMDIRLWNKFLLFSDGTMPYLWAPKTTKDF